MFLTSTINEQTSLPERFNLIPFSYEISGVGFRVRPFRAEHVHDRLVALHRRLPAIVLAVVGLAAAHHAALVICPSTCHPGVELRANLQ